MLTKSNKLGFYVTTNYSSEERVSIKVVDKGEFEFGLTLQNNIINITVDLDGIYELLLGKRPVIRDICITGIVGGCYPLFLVKSRPKKRLDLNLRSLLKQEEIDFDLFYYNSPDYVFDLTQLIVTPEYKYNITGCYIVYVEGSTFSSSLDQVFYRNNNLLFVDCNLSLECDYSYEFMRLTRKLFEVKLEPWKRKKC